MAKVEHLNHSRQLVRQCLELLDVPSLDDQRRAAFSAVVDLHGASQNKQSAAPWSASA